MQLLIDSIRPSWEIDEPERIMLIRTILNDEMFEKILTSETQIDIQSVPLMILALIETIARRAQLVLMGFHNLIQSQYRSVQCNYRTYRSRNSFNYKIIVI
jgi:transcriptional regulatory protein LevR